MTESNTSAGFAVTQGTFRLADNFTISQPCTLNNVVFYAYQTSAPASPSPFTAYTLQIHNGRPGDPGVIVVFGDTTTNRLASSVDSTFFRIFNTAVPPPGTPPGTTRKIWRNTVTIGTTLAAGTYWLNWASTVTNLGGHFQPSKTIAGSRGAPGDNARQLTVATGVWVDALDTGNPGTAPDVPQDFPFDLNGTVPAPSQSESLALSEGVTLGGNSVAAYRLDFSGELLSAPREFNLEALSPWFNWRLSEMSLLRPGEPVQENVLSGVQRDEGPGASVHLSTMLLGPWQKEFTTEAGREVARLIRAGPEPALKSSRFLTL
jgi:hypothetical protein